MKKRIPNIIANAHAICGMLTILLLNCSCSNPPDKYIQQEQKSPGKKPLVIKKPVSSFNDTIIIDSKSAVFYTPDSLQMEKIKTVNEKAIFATIAHDCFYQMQNARMVLKKYWPQIRVVETSKARYLLFVKVDKSKICIDLNDKNDICGVFLFDRRKHPVLIDMPNIDTALGFYFKNTRMETSKKSMSLKSLLFVIYFDILNNKKNTST